MRKRLYALIFSIIFSISQYIGLSIDNKISNNILIKILCILFLIFISYIISIVTFNYLDKYKMFQNSNNKLLNFFDKHTYIISFVTIFICWLPILILKYPGILAYDGNGQLLQFFGYAQMTNHHPVLHTVLIGLFVKLGKLIYSYNLGIFLSILFQTSILVGVLSYTIVYMKKLNINIKYRLLVLVIYSISINYPVAAACVTKDILYTPFLILYTILFMEFIKNKNIGKKNIISFIIVFVLVSIFRKDGILITLLSFPILMFINKKNIKILIFIFLISTFIYSGYRVTLKYYNIPDGSIKEIFSVPFMQTTRYIKEYPDEVGNDEKYIINKVLDYDKLVDSYNPKHADLVKRKFRSDVSTKDLISYFKVYTSMFFKHPKVYFRAFFETSYGYFYIDHNGRMLGDYNPEDDIVNYFNFHYIDKINNLRKLFCNFQHILGEKIIIFKARFHTMIIIFMYIYLLYRKKYKYSLVFIPVLLNILVCLLSPTFMYRMAIHYIYQVPLLISLFVYIINERSLSNE